MADYGLPTRAELQGIWLALERASRARSDYAAPEPDELVDADWRLGWE